MKQVLFLDSIHPALEERLLAMGFECTHDYTSPYGKIAETIGKYTGLAIRSRIPIDAALIASAKKLKFIARSGAGLENIDTHAAHQAGIAVLNSPEGNRDAVGEHAIGMLLMLLHRLHLADAQVKRGVWDREGNRGIELAGKTIGIIGYGHMGSAFAKKLSGFGCRILAHDKYKTAFGESHVIEVNLADLQREADVVSLHLPLSAETHHYVNDAFINGCAKPFYLINTARGQHVQIDALLRGLVSGKVRGACLDVLEYESRSFEKLTFDALPPTFQALAAHRHVVLSPHIAGWTAESYIKLSAVLADKIEKHFG